MNKIPDTNSAGEPGASRVTHLAPLLWAAFLALWAVQIWRPQLSYPSQGLIEVLAAAAMLCVSEFLARRNSDSRAFTLAPALALAFCAWTWLRWLAAGTPANGADNFGTILAATCSGATAYYLLRAQPAGRDTSAIRLFLLAFSAAALACSVHACLQYFILYPRQYAELKASLAGVEPTQLQLGILHHLKIRRVASVWGDPNILGGFLAMSIPASIVCVFCARHAASKMERLAGMLIALPGVMLALAGIWFTGSRGALLDVALGLILLAAIWWRKRLWRVAAAGAALMVLAGFGGVTPSDATSTATVTTTTTSRLQAMLSRSDTIRERFHYTQVGWRIIQENPWFGSAPGAVDLLYGHFKPAEARETKYLHNWVLQIGAESGGVGLAIAVMFLVLMLGGALRSGAPGGREMSAVIVMALVFVFDGLLELSFNSRELMGSFGILCGVMLCQNGIVLPASSRRARFPVGLAVAAFITALMAAYLVPTLAASSLKQIAQDAMEDANSAEARRLLQRARSWTPRDPSILMMLSQINEREGNRSDALMLVRQAIAIQPGSAALNAQAAELLLTDGRTDEAQQMARRALEIYPANAEYHYLMARVLDKRGDRPGAILEARRAVELGYQFVDRYQNYLKTLERK